MNLQLIDVHCHLMHDAFKGRIEELIARSREANVKVIVTSGVNHATNVQAMELAEKYDIVKATAGIYPIELLDMPPDETGLAQDEELILEDELKWIKKNKERFIGIGEVGLDYHWDKENHELQKQNFQKIIDFVEKIKLPIILHTRKAERDCFDMLQSSSIKKVLLHCFQAKKGLIKEVADSGYYLSIPAVVNKLQHFQMVIDLMPQNRLLTETDAPWQSPYAGKPNEPAFTIEAIKKIAEIKNLDLIETGNLIMKNYLDLFG